MGETARPGGTLMGRYSGVPPLAVLEELSEVKHLDSHETVEVITRLQKSPTADWDALFL